MVIFIGPPFELELDPGLPVVKPIAPGVIVPVFPVVKLIAPDVYPLLFCVAVVHNILPVVPLPASPLFTLTSPPFPPPEEVAFPAVKVTLPPTAPPEDKARSAFPAVKVMLPPPAAPALVEPGVVFEAVSVRPFPAIVEAA